MRDLISEASGFDGEPGCSPRHRSAPARAIPASRSSNATAGSAGSSQPVPRRGSTGGRWSQACSDADIVVSERWLPKGCTPRWLKLDRKALESTGGVAIYLDDVPRIETVASRLGEHPWR